MSNTTSQLRVSDERGANAFAFLERFASRSTAWTEQWMPDAFIFALGGTLVIAVAAFLVDGTMRADPLRIVDAWGNGFWSLIPFTLQMAMMIIRRLRAGHLAEGLPIDSASRGDAQYGEGRRGSGGIRCHGELAAELGIQPDLRRGARARSGAPRAES